MPVWFRRVGYALAAVGAAAVFAYIVAADRSMRAPSADDKPAESAAHAPTAAERSAARGRRGEVDTETLSIGWTAWADAEVMTRLARRILQERMGYKVELTMADIGIQYQGLLNGDLDVMLMAWLPVTHESYWQRAAGGVVDLGPIYTRARLGWAVPAYVPEDVLGSMQDLKRAEVRRRLQGRIQGIDPGSGLMQASERALAAYGLERYELVASSGAAMTAAVQRAVRRNEWIVVTAWNPHWMFARWELRYLKDPKGVLGGRERIHALVRRGFYQDYPSEVTEFFTRMYVPLDELEQTLLYATQTSTEKAVERYLREHPARVDYWVTGALP